MPYTELDVHDLYYKIGKNIWKIQHLENLVATFTTMVIIQKRREQSKYISEEESHKILKKQKGLTLGRMIKNAQKQGTIPSHLAKKFDFVLKERNWIVHNCVASDMLSLQSTAPKKLLFDRLDDCSKNVTSLMNSMFELHNSWFTQKGYNLQRAFDNAEEMFQAAEDN